MFREITYITLILSMATFGTEIIFRLKPENQALGKLYTLQSNIVIASSIVEVVASLAIVKYIEKIPKFSMKILMLVILTPLIAAIALRSKFNFFMPLDDKKYNVYNATSFFLCISTITWATLWFFKSERPLTDPEIALSDTRGTRQRSDRHNSTRATETPPSVHRYDADIDYTLPSYSEVPPPPAYNKVMYSSREAHVEQVEDIPATATDPSFQNRNSTTITNEAISNSSCNVETNRATTTQSNESVRQ